MHRALFYITLLALLASASAARPLAVQPGNAASRPAGGTSIYLPIMTKPAPPFTYVVDRAMTPSQPALPGLKGGLPRPVGMLLGPGGERSEFVANEVMFHPETQQQLDAFLAKYAGTVLRDGTPLILGEDGTVRAAQTGSSGWYLVRIDPQRSTTNDLAANMQSAGVGGAFVFSSDDAVRLAAVVAREVTSHVLPNLLMYGDGIPEHPDGKGGNVDAATFWWLTEDDDPATPGDQGLSVGVVHAWEYLRYMGLPPTAGGSWRPIKIAIVDGGFDLDEQTGFPLNGNTDYFFRSRPPFQIDLIDYDGTAGGPNPMKCSGGSNCPWHGQEAFGVAAAYPGNGFGSAGTGGELVRPMLIKVDKSLYTLIEGIRAAHLNGADVISISISGGCGAWAWACELPEGEFDIYSSMQYAILHANADGVVVVASAGNAGKPIDAGSDPIPCKLRGVICVGSVRRDKMNDDNYGGPVDIWAPTGVKTTVTRESAAADGGVDNVGEDELAEFWGTSAATPFVAGIAGLMKALDPALPWDRVQQILQETANPSPDSKVARGYVDAFRAVARVRPNQPPTVAIRPPSSDGTVSWGHGVSLWADVSDPESPALFKGSVVFSSDRDGQLCTPAGGTTAFACTSPPLSLGTHTITARATDPFGAAGSASVQVQVINHAPAVTISYPDDGSTFFTSQIVNLRGFAVDEDEPILDAGLVWSSDRDGVLASGHDVDVTLSQGVHEITLTAADALGSSAQDRITITMQAGEGIPTARILSPDDGAEVESGALTTFQGKGTDPEDGVLPGDRLEWFSNRDGFLGTGSTVGVVLSGPHCDPTRHTITLRVTDSDGHQATHEILVLVGKIC